MSFGPVLRVVEKQAWRFFLARNSALRKTEGVT